MPVQDKTRAGVHIPDTNAKGGAISRPSRDAHAGLRDPKPSSKALPQEASLSHGSDSAEPLPALSSREREILTRVAHGLSNQHIAEELGVSPYTIRCTLHHASTKLKARSRLEAVYIAVIRGYISLDEILGVDDLIAIFASLGSQVLRETAKRLQQRRLDELVNLLAPFEPTMLHRAARQLSQRHQQVQLPPVVSKGTSKPSGVSGLRTHE